MSFITAFMYSGLLFGQKNYRTLVYEGNEKFNGKDYDGASVKYLEAIRTNSKDLQRITI
ncbi:hypothetical protein ACFOEQ_24135 [Chryseobacterium arachidis]|uniref:hypothetical protein n=1 Tax=Chryseobacterium arachidis TaxID=1416778 RepID=UPI0036077CD9